MLKLTIRDHNQSLCEHLRQKFSCEIEKGLVTVQCGDIFMDTDFDGLVSPANSFGAMDGGVDYVYLVNMGQQIQDRLQAHIKETTPFGEILVGDARIVETHWKIPYLIAAPTMRFPSPIPPVHIYLATRAALFSAHQEKLSTIMMPGLGTGTGRVPVEDAAFAMYSGYVAFMQRYGSDPEGKTG